MKQPFLIPHRRKDLEDYYLILCTLFGMGLFKQNSYLVSLYNSYLQIVYLTGL